ncbi:hypothetical protein WDV93_22675 [Pantoea ananatis]
MLIVLGTLSHSLLAQDSLPGKIMTVIGTPPGAADCVGPGRLATGHPPWLEQR